MSELPVPKDNRQLREIKRVGEIPTDLATSKPLTNVSPDNNIDPHMGESKMSGHATVLKADMQTAVRAVDEMVKSNPKIPIPPKEALGIAQQAIEATRAALGQVRANSESSTR